MKLMQLFIMRGLQFYALLATGDEYLCFRDEIAISKGWRHMFIQYVKCKVV